MFPPGPVQPGPTKRKASRATSTGAAGAKLFPTKKSLCPVLCYLLPYSKSACHVNIFGVVPGLSPESEVEDETHLLEVEGEDAEEVEADAWASEAEPEAEAEEEAKGTAPEHQSLPQMSSKNDAGASQMITDMLPAQRPPPARRKWAPMHAPSTWVHSICPI